MQPAGSGSTRRPGPLANPCHRDRRHPEQTDVGPLRHPGEHPLGSGPHIAIGDGHAAGPEGCADTRLRVEAAGQPPYGSVLHGIPRQRRERGQRRRTQQHSHRDSGQRRPVLGGAPDHGGEPVPTRTRGTWARPRRRSQGRGGHMQPPQNRTCDGDGVSQSYQSSPRPHKDRRCRSVDARWCHPDQDPTSFICWGVGDAFGRRVHVGRDSPWRWSAVGGRWPVADIPVNSKTGMAAPNGVTVGISLSRCPPRSTPSRRAQPRATTPWLSGRPLSADRSARMPPPRLGQAW